MRTPPLRRLTVNNVPYLWRLHSHNGDGDGGIGLRVWRGKKVIIERWFGGMHDPFPITPRVVAECIKTFTEAQSVRALNPV